MEEGKLKFAVVGCGHIGKRHAFMINQHPMTELEGLVDSNPIGISDLESNFNTRFFGTFEEFIKLKPSVDVVCICTPNGLHAPQSIACLNAGYHVVCEKPMALSVNDCHEIIATAENQKRSFFCVTQNRYSPPAQWLHKMIKNNRLGNIFLVQVTGFWNRDNRYYKSGWKGTKALDGGTLFTQFSHFVDTLIWIFGGLEVTNSILQNFNHPDTIDFEDTGIFNFNLPNGGIGSFSYSTSIWDKNMQSTILIIGEKGTIKIGGQYMEDITYCHVQDYSLEPLESSSVPVHFENYSGSAANHYLLIDDVVNALNNNETQLATHNECLSVVRVITDVYRLGAIN